MATTTYQQKSVNGVRPHGDRQSKKATKKFNHHDALRASNVVVLRTFSKLMSLAAVRLGVMIGNPDLIGYARNLRLTFDVNSIALLFAERLMEHPEVVGGLIEAQREGKDYCLVELRARGYWCRDCMGNFIFIKPHIRPRTIACCYWFKGERRWRCLKI